VPERIQLRRTRGWRKPEGAIVVARPSRWGNPYTVGAVGVAWSGETGGDAGFYGERRVWVDSAPLGPLTAEQSVSLYRDDLVANLADPDPHFDDLRDALAELAGHDLACWCPLDAPCHGDVLLELASR
jgi:hypothetical protein